MVRRRWERGASVAGMWASLAVGCNALSGLDADYHVGTSGLDADLDASAANDVVSGDGSAPDVASSDGGSRDAALPVGCPSGALYCDDFEDATKAAPTFGWTRSETGANGPKVEPLAGWNGSRALHAKAVAAGSTKAVLWKTVRTGFDAGKRMTVSIGIRVASATIDYAVVAAIQLNALEYGLAVYKNALCPGGGVCLDENDQAGGHDFSLATPLTLGKWYRVDISVTRTGNAYGGKVVVDGTTTLDDRATGALPAGSPSAVEIGVGAFYTGPTGTTETFVDDVVVRYE